MCNTFHICHRFGPESEIYGLSVFAPNSHHNPPVHLYYRSISHLALEGYGGPSQKNPILSLLFLFFLQLLPIHKHVSGRHIPLVPRLASSSMCGWQYIHYSNPDVRQIFLTGWLAVAFIEFKACAA